MSDRSHIPSLDGIRAIAALWVFAYHAGIKHALPGAFGVTVFFFLSGYLITTLLRLEYEKNGRISLKKFYLRRAFRILPPMYLVLCVALLLWVAHLLPGRPTMDAVIAQFGHLTNYFIIVRGPGSIIPSTGIMWSLAVEEHFYLLYPLILIALLHRYDRPRIAVVLACICLLELLWRCYLLRYLTLDDNYTYVATDARMDSLLFGCILGIWCNPAVKAETVELKSWLWAMILVLATAVLVFSFRYRSVYLATYQYSIQGIALLPIFYCAVRYSDWPIFRWLEQPAVRGMGIISYTFYLIHPAAIHITQRYLHHPHWSWVISLGAAIAFATAMYFLIERRLTALRHRFSAAPSTP